MYILHCHHISQMFYFMYIIMYVINFVVKSQGLAKVLGFFVHFA
jgi:hypothetical protein